jgi:hypothetical protein
MTTYRCLRCGHLVALPSGEAPRGLAHSRAYAPGEAVVMEMHEGEWEVVSRPA